MITCVGDLIAVSFYPSSVALFDYPIGVPYWEHYADKGVQALNSCDSTFLLGNVECEINPDENQICQRTDLLTSRSQSTFDKEEVKGQEERRRAEDTKINRGDEKSRRGTEQRKKEEPKCGPCFFERFHTGVHFFSFICPSGEGSTKPLCEQQKETDYVHHPWFFHRFPNSLNFEEGKWKKKQVRVRGGEEEDERKQKERGTEKAEGKRGRRTRTKGRGNKKSRRKQRETQEERKEKRKGSESWNKEKQVGRKGKRKGKDRRKQRKQARRNKGQQ